MKKHLVVLCFALSVLCVTDVAGCSRGSRFSFDELFEATLIVRAVAEKYTVDPDPHSRTTGVPESKVEFRIEEVLRGKIPAKTLELPGYLSERDDYNELRVPYTFVRPGGRAGSCFANTYKKGASFLLFLVKTEGSYTSNISALGPTNEQLRGIDDPWLKWTRAEVKRRDGTRR